MFQPPRCPYPTCSQHQRPEGRFYYRRGAYRARCRARPVPRFSCRHCGRWFSRQTFRADYRDHRPLLNPKVIRELCAGKGLRQTARDLGLSRSALVEKARKISRNARRLDLNLKSARRASFPPRKGDVHRVHFDELETYEGRRNTRPLSIALLIESTTRFQIAAIAAPIRPRGRMTTKRVLAIASEQARFGVRVDRSRLACRSAFRRAARLFDDAAGIALFTDEKSTYPGFAERAFGQRLVRHSQTPSVLTRDSKNPLFAINHTEACMRDWMGRLRRESWLVTKVREQLNLHLGLYGAVRNWVRPRFNRDRKTPAQLLGLAARPLRLGELAGWRQDWGLRSPDPFGDGTRDVRADG